MAHYDRQGERNENKNDTGRDPGAGAAGVRGMASPSGSQATRSLVSAEVGLRSQSESSYAAIVRGWVDGFWWMQRDFVAFHKHGRTMSYTLNWRSL